MGITYTLLVLSFIAIIFLNLGWAITNLYFFIVEGVQTLLVGSTFVENIYFSTFLPANYYKKIYGNLFKYEEKD